MESGGVAVGRTRATLFTMHRFFRISLLLSFVTLFMFIPRVEASTRTLSYFLQSGTSQRISSPLSRRLLALGEMGQTAGTELGSVPLDPASESRLERYILHDNCPVTLNMALHNRCQYLLKFNRFQGSLQSEDVRVSPRARRSLDSVSAGNIVRRSVGGREHYLPRTMNGIPRLRTIQDIEGRYEGITIERSRAETTVR